MTCEPGKKRLMKKIQIALMVTALSIGAFGAQAQDVKVEAKANFEKFCAGCHGKDGKGDTKLGEKLEARDYTDAKVQSTLKEEEMFKAIKEGLKKGDKVLMKPYNDKFTDAQIKALVAHIKTFAKK
jgi:cytochrome c553